MSSEKALMVVTAMVYADSGEKETLDNELFSSKKGVIIINFVAESYGFTFTRLM
jgi:hypothetical protein